MAWGFFKSRAAKSSSASGGHTSSGSKGSARPDPTTTAAFAAHSLTYPKFARDDPKPLVVGGTILRVLSGLVTVVTFPLIVLQYASVFKKEDKLLKVANKAPGPVKKLGHAAVVAATATPADIARTKAGGKMGRFAQLTVGDGTIAKLSQIPISQGVVAASTAMGGFILTRSFSRKLSMLQHMETEISGRKVSKMEILRGKVSPIVQAARKEALGWYSIGAFGFEVGMVGYVLARIFSNKQDIGGIPMEAMRGGFQKKDLALMAGSYAVTKIIPDAIGKLKAGQTILAGYELAHKAMAMGQPIPLDAYKAMLAGLVPGAYMPEKERDPKDPHKQRMITDATECFERQIPPQEFLRTLSAELYPESKVGAWTAKNQDKNPAVQSETWAARTQDKDPGSGLETWVAKNQDKIPGSQPEAWAAKAQDGKQLTKAQVTLGA